MRSHGVYFPCSLPTRVHVVICFFGVFFFFFDFYLRVLLGDPVKQYRSFWLLITLCSIEPGCGSSFQL